MTAVGYGKAVWEFFRLNNFLVVIQTAKHTKKNAFTDKRDK